MGLQVTPKQLPELLSDVLEAKLVPMIHGSPAIGKSDIGRQIASKYNLFMIDVRLSQSDTVDLNGFPMMDAEKGLASYMPFDIFPTTATKIPEGYSGFLLFLDEINSAPLSVQAAAYKLILDRAVGQHKLHDKTAIIAAGNLATDKAIVNRMSTATQSRMVHFELVVDNEAWLKWAADHDVDHRIRSFVKFKPEILHSFKPDHDDHTFPAPRTWEFMSRLIKGYPKSIPQTKLPLMAGTVGEGAAREFFSYCKIFKTLLTVQQIEKDPMGVKVPEEPGTQYALAGSIGQHMDKNNVVNVMKFLERMEPEMQILCLQGALKRDISLMQENCMRTWIDKYSAELF